VRDDVTRDRGKLSLDDLLVCPVCKGQLRMEADSQSVPCIVCGRTYCRLGAALDFLPDTAPDADVAARWPLWEQLESNAVVAYENDPSGNLSISPRRDYAAFTAFAELDGIVLDVGCGPQSLPWYASALSGAFVGIDPLIGSPDREFAFVRGLGEYLPFRAAAFDRVLFTTSLDHLLVPERALAEARRVVNPAGNICIWFAEAATSAARDGVASNAWYDALEVPAGAADRFHAARFDLGLVRDLIAAVGLVVVDMERLDGTPSIFIRARSA
jgi:SAM-dependent methyltransferase